MRVAGVEWDHMNLMHFYEHGRCQRREVEDILFARCHPTRMATEMEREKGAEARQLFFGRTCADRYLAVVAAPQPGRILRPITCWPLPMKSVERYEAWRRTVKGR